MDILNIILESIKDGNYDLIGIVLLISISIWFYNEFRKSYMTSKSENKSYIEESLEKISRLYFGILSFQLKSINLNELLEYVNQAIPYLSRKVTKELLELDKENLNINSSELENIKKTVRNEINSIKFNQYTITTVNSDGDIFERGFWFLSKNNFDSFISPLIYSFFALIGALYLVVIGAAISNLTGFQQINFIIFLFNTIFSVMILMHLADLSIKKLSKSKTYIYFCLLIILPFCLIIFIFNMKYSIINTITIILFLFIANKNELLKPNNKLIKGDNK